MIINIWIKCANQYTECKKLTITRRKKKILTKKCAHKLLD